MFFQRNDFLHAIFSLTPSLTHHFQSFSLSNGDFGFMKKVLVGTLGLVLVSALVWAAGNAPVITTQPKSQTVNEGESVTFSVVATGGLDLDMIWIKPGTFTRSGYNVTLSKGFWLGKYEVTQAQYEAVMGTNPSYFKGSDLPVECVTWHNATNFCAKLNAQEKAAGRLPSGYEYTLPTEAQWEYACRAGTTGDYNVNGATLSDLGWYADNSNSKTHPVGQKKPNAWGLYDMHGNVWEWCLDWYGDYPSSAVTDPKGPSSGSDRVIRGGGWSGNANRCRSAYRNLNYPGFGYGHIGFRVALAPVQ